MPTSASDLAHLRLERPSDGVALLTLDNPDQRNAMSDAMTASWPQALARVADDPAVRVLVVTGAGSAFCSGGNTSWIASEPDASVDQLRSRMQAFYRTWLGVRALEVPTIAANAPVPTRYTKVALRQGHPDLESAITWEAFSQPITLATADLQEGISAAQEKRPARFTGH